MLSSILQFFAGLAVFLYGVHLMGDGLEKITGAKVRKSVYKISKNRYAGAGLGAGITTLLQSSAASTVMIIGFTSAGLLSLFQACSLIIGSNVGIAFCSILVSFKTFKIVDFFSAFSVIGVFMVMFLKNNKAKQVGNVIAGLGFLFLGISLMNSSISVISASANFNNFIISLSNPLLLILIGILFTSIVHSSLATLAILVALAGTALVPGAITLESAAYIIYGCNIGTCITAVLASLTSTKDGRRVALMHVLFNVIGCIIFSLLTAFTPWLDWIRQIFAEPSFQIVFVNIIFNVVTAVILLPAMKMLIWLSKIIIRDKKGEENSVIAFDDNIFQIPTIALTQLNMGIKIAYEQALSFADKLFEFVEGKSKIEYILQEKEKSEKILLSGQNIENSTIKLPGDVGIKEQRNINFIHSSTANLEKVIKCCYRLLKEIIISKKQRVNFTINQTNSIKKLADLLQLMFKDYNIIMLNYVEDKDNALVIDNLNMLLENGEKLEVVKNTIKKGIISEEALYKKTIEQSAAFLNVINNLEQIADYITDNSLKIIRDSARLKLESGENEKNNVGL